MPSPTALTSRSGLRGVLVAVLLLSLVLPAEAGAAAGSAGTPTASTGWSAPVPLPGQPALRVTSRGQVRDRLWEYTFQTAAIPGTTYVRVLLPRNYRSRTTRRYPVLLLLNGCCNGAPQARDWTTPEAKGDAERAVGGADLITVMPDAGMGGQYTDWVRPGALGQPRWESYLIGQLLPWIDATFRTRADRSGRAIAGLSMGGFGAMSLAARHPDTFVSASSFSGIVDSNMRPAFVLALSALDGGAPDSVFGDRTIEQVLWRTRNPVDLAGNLRRLGLDLYTGNGRTPEGVLVDPNEANVHDHTLSLSAALTTAGIPHSLSDYGVGRHDWPEWDRDLRDVLPRVLDRFAAPTDPASFDHTSADAAFSVYGYEVSLRREAREFASLTDVTAGGLTVSGSGGVRVRTAPRYLPGRRYRVSTRSEHLRQTRYADVVADSRGRLDLSLTLCPSNTTDQYAPADVAPRRSCTSQVAIAAAR